MPQVSIIIPTKDRLESLINVLPSYLNQHSIAEIIIVDDGGGEMVKGALMNLIERNSIIKVISPRRHNGLPTARNIGVREAKGEYIIFGEDDVIFEVNYIEQLLKCLNKCQADIISGRIIPLIDGGDREMALRIADSDPADFINEKLVFYRLWQHLPDDKAVYFTHACSLIRREVFDRVLFSELYKGNAVREEVDFHIRARKSGFKIFFCPHTCIYHFPYNSIKIGGGCHSAPMSSTYFFIKNNYIFYRRHYAYLRDEGFVRYSFIKLIFFVLIDRALFLSRCMIKRNYWSQYGIRLRSEAI